MISCPGCGGWNAPDAKVCEWCGRSFLAQPRRLPPPILAFGAVAFLAAAVLVGGAVALVSFIATLSVQSGAEPTPTPVRLTPAPAEFERELSRPSAEPIAPAEEFVRIANTGGTGAFLREEPRSAARGMVAYPDRTVLRVIGPDVVTEGRVWRNLEDQRGTRGWTPNDFLTPSDVGF